MSVLPEKREFDDSKIGIINYGFNQAVDIFNQNLDEALKWNLSEEKLLEVFLEASHEPGMFTRNNTAGIKALHTHIKKVLKG